jgi:hypothetical protein
VPSCIYDHGLTLIEFYVWLLACQYLDQRYDSLGVFFSAAGGVDRGVARSRVVSPMPPCVILRLVIRLEAELGEWWAEKVWVAVPCVFRSGVEIVIEDAGLTAIACPQYGERLTDVEEVHVLLITELVVGLRLHDEAVQWLKGWALALKDEAVKKKAVEKARRVKHCRF